MNKCFNLDGRLKECAEMVTENSKLVDIGTDHAYLPIWMILNGIVRDAIATDAKEEPLKRALNNIKKYGLEDKIQTRLSDGFDKIKKNECGSIVIAGMGGETIIEILNRATWLKNCENVNLILQPMTCAEKLRRYLNKNCYGLCEERAVESNSKIYSVMKAKRDFNSQQSSIEPYVGKIFYSFPKTAEQISATLKYADKEIVNLSNRLKGMKIRGKTDEAETLKEIIKEIGKERACYNEKYCGNL